MPIEYFQRIKGTTLVQKLQEVLIAEIFQSLKHSK